MLASEVMDRAAGLLNDQAKATFTYTNMLTYLGQANDELIIQLALHGISVEKQVSANATIAKGSNTFAIPSDMLVPESMWERLSGSSDVFSEMTERERPPETSAGSSFVWWTYNNLLLTLGPANNAGALTDREVKLLYTRVLTALSSQNSVVEVTLAKTFLATRTAALSAQYIGENDERAMKLDVEARGKDPDVNIGGHLGDLIRIYVRNLQGGGVRRRGYRRPMIGGRR